MSNDGEFQILIFVSIGALYVMFENIKRGFLYSHGRNALPFTFTLSEDCFTNLVFHRQSYKFLSQEYHIYSKQVPLALAFKRTFQKKMCLYQSYNSHNHDGGKQFVCSRYCVERCPLSRYCVNRCPLSRYCVDRCPHSNS